MMMTSCSMALVIAGGQAYGIRAYAGSVQARAAYSEAGDPFAQGSSDRIKLKKVKASAGVNTMTLKFKRAVTKKEIQDINAYYGLTGKETATRGEACYIIDETEGTLGPVSVTVSRGSKKAATGIATASYCRVGISTGWWTTRISWEASPHTHRARPPGPRTPLLR